MWFSQGGHAAQEEKKVATRDTSKKTTVRAMLKSKSSGLLKASGAGSPRTLTTAMMDQPMMDNPMHTSSRSPALVATGERDSGT